LGRWSVPDRSSVVSEEKPLFEERRMTATDGFTSSLSLFANTKEAVKSITDWHIGGQLHESEFSEVILAEDQKRKVKRAVKTLKNETLTEAFNQESSIHARLNHPLIIGFEGTILSPQTHQPAIVTEFVPNGSLAEHLPLPVNSDESIVTGETRIAMIVVGIVLGMRYLHSLGILHLNLNPETVFVDWDWIVRIGNFSHSVIWEDVIQKHWLVSSEDHLNCRYTAPECFERVPTLTSDVFSFGLILYELLSGKPGFDCDTPAPSLMKQIVVDNVRPDIPDFVCDDVASLIEDCWAENPDDRPSFVDILFRLDRMDFQITPGVKSGKVRRFVEAVKSLEKVLGIEIEDLD
jgi:serine/threonine protein kinase